MDKKFEFSMIPTNNREIPQLSEVRVSGKDYVNWGTDNKFPDYLWDLYLKSATLQSIINGNVDYICGNGIEFWKEDTVINKYGEEIDEFVKKLATDYEIFGGFAFNIIEDFDGNVAELYWMDMRNVRVDEDEKYVYYCEKWNKYGQKAIKYPIYNPAKRQKSSVCFYKSHLSRGLYPIPPYIGALAAIETSTEIGKFHLNNILNNLTSSAIISFNNGIPTDEEKHALEEKIKEKFSGSENAGKFLLTFNDSKENAVTVERLSEDGMDQKFHTLNDSTKQEIFTAFRAQPMLFGLLPDNTAFNKMEFLESFELYNKTVIKPIQKVIMNVINTVYNTIDSIKIIPFSLDEINNEGNDVN